MNCLTGLWVKVIFMFEYFHSFPLVVVIIKRKGHFSYIFSNIYIERNEENKMNGAVTNMCCYISLMLIWAFEHIAFIVAASGGQKVLKHDLIFFYFFLSYLYSFYIAALVNIYISCSFCLLDISSTFYLYSNVYCFKNVGTGKWTRFAPVADASLVSVRWRHMFAYIMD